MTKNFYGNPSSSPCTKHLSSGLQHDLAQAIPKPYLIGSFDRYQYGKLHRVYSHRVPVSSTGSLVGVIGHAVGWATKDSWFNSRYERDSSFLLSFQADFVAHTTSHSSGKKNCFHGNNADGTEDDH